MHAKTPASWWTWSVRASFLDTLAAFRLPLILFLAFALLAILSGCGTTDLPVAAHKPNVPAGLMAKPLGPVWLSPPTSSETSSRTQPAGLSAAPRSGDGRPGLANTGSRPEGSALPGDAKRTEQ